MKINIQKLLRPFLMSLCAIGAVLVILGAYFTILNKRTTDWSPSSAIVESLNTSEIAGASGPISSRGVVYRYIFQNKEYRSSRIRFGLVASNGQYAGGKVGDHITVYVNRQSPVESVVETGNQVGDYIIVGLGSFVAVFAAATLLILRKTDLSQIADIEIEG